ncbi:MAG: phosphatidate cytidylyltransferase, partial [bacterium]
MSFHKDFISRFAIALLFGLGGLFLAWYSRHTLLLVFVLFVLIGMAEYFNLLERAHYRPFRIPGCLAALIFLIVGYFGTDERSMENLHYALALGAITLVLLKALQLKTTRYRETITFLILTFFGSLYIGGSLSCIMNLRTIHDLKFSAVTPRDYLFLLPFIGAWAGDTGAYLAGHLLGREKIDIKVSEGKTVEGFLGAMAAGFVAIYIFGNVLHFPKGLSILLGLILPVIGVVGDMFESAL